MIPIDPQTTPAGGGPAPKAVPPPLPRSSHGPPRLPERRYRTPARRKLSWSMLGAGVVGAFALALIGSGVIANHAGDIGPAAVEEQEPVSAKRPLLWVLSDGLAPRLPYALNDSLTIVRVFPNRPTELRYQMRLERVAKADIRPNAYFYREQMGLRRAVATDSIAGEVLRAAPAIFVDVYDRDDEFLFSYDWDQVELFGG